MKFDDRLEGLTQTSNGHPRPHDAAGMLEVARALRAAPELSSDEGAELADAIADLLRDKLYERLKAIKEAGG